MSAIRARPATLPRRDAAFVLLAVAGLAALVAAVDPRPTRAVALRDLLLVVDITRSMNVRDMDLGAGPISRLDAVRVELPALIARLPCGSRVGLGVFTERRSLVFLDPVEVCENAAPLTAAIEALDWRMAWEGDSMIVRGLHDALDRAAGLGADLVFLTDGHEAPPPPYSGPPRRKPGAAETRGLILGVGGLTPAPIPRFDRAGREIGFYRPEDVQQAPARIGPPPADAASRPGFHSRNNPYGEADLVGAEHLSSLRAAHLAEQAAALDLGYASLGDGNPATLAALEGATGARVERRRTSISGLPAALAIAALAASYLARALQDQTRRHERQGE